jgi:hypothetical protein
LEILSSLIACQLFGTLQRKVAKLANFRANSELTISIANERRVEALIERHAHGKPTECIQ